MYRHTTSQKADIKVNFIEAKQTFWLIRRLILVQIPVAFVCPLIL